MLSHPALHRGAGRGTRGQERVNVASRLAAAAAARRRQAAAASGLHAAAMTVCSFLATLPNLRRPQGYARDWEAPSWFWPACSARMATPTQ